MNRGETDLGVGSSQTSRSVVFGPDQLISIVRRQINCYTALKEDRIIIIIAKITKYVPCSPKSASLIDRDITPLPTSNQTASAPSYNPWAVLERPEYTLRDCANLEIESQFGVKFFGSLGTIYNHSYTIGWMITYSH